VFASIARSASMILLVSTVVVVGLLLAVPFFGADSRDGRDWQPLRLPTALPDTDRPPLRPTSARRAARLRRRKDRAKWLSRKARGWARRGARMAGGRSSS
jgi:hypothetical protein